MKRIAITLMLLLGAGCGAVNVPVLGGNGFFGNLRPDYDAVPEAGLRALAQEIERAVMEGNRDAAIPDRPSLRINTPEMQQAIRTRAARAALIQELLEEGHAYEQRGGLVAIARGRAYQQATTKLQRDKNALVIMGENSNRWMLYEGIIKANNFSGKALSAVRVIFFEARRELAPPGHRFEDGSGALIEKGK